MRRHEVHRAFLQFDAITLTAIHDVEEGIALELPKVFFQRIVMKIRALVGAANNGDDEIGAGPDLLVAYWRFQQMRIAGKPGRR